MELKEKSQLQLYSDKLICYLWKLQEKLIDIGFKSEFKQQMLTYGRGSRFEKNKFKIFFPSEYFSTLSKSQHQHKQNPNVCIWSLDIKREMSRQILCYISLREHVFGSDIR